MKYRISAVSYTNSKPFIYGIEKMGLVKKIDLSLDIPSECARKLIANQADIGLVPVAALSLIPDYHIIADYCIGANGPVNSVFIFADKPIEDIRTLRLDLQSRTSNNLAKVLLENYWKLSPEIVEGEADAFVEIGDRTFGKKHKYHFAYDLAEEWMKFTGLPFVFAVWASNKPIASDFITGFNKALKYGVDNRHHIISQLPSYEDFDMHDYLMTRIDYKLDDKKKLSLNKFFELIKSL